MVIQTNMQSNLEYYLSFSIFRQKKKMRKIQLSLGRRGIFKLDGLKLRSQSEQNPLSILGDNNTKDNSVMAVYRILKIHSSLKARISLAKLVKIKFFRIIKINQNLVKIQTSKTTSMHFKSERI